MASYSFETTWRFAAPIEAVWDAISDYSHWSSWWPSVIEARRLEPGDERGIGERTRFVFRTRLPYKLVFELKSSRIEPPTLLEGQATGELEGLGRWRLTPEGEGTRVDYLWQVQTTRPWMNLLAPLLRPLFAWNHDQVMEVGRRGLERLLTNRGSGARPSAPPAAR